MKGLVNDEGLVNAGRRYVDRPPGAWTVPHGGGKRFRDS
ncbi:hypothetical protein BMG523Draft_03715 [Frankia sp. BMG5.23]|jgi:hypothetical protein|nr:hypothetical protein BMG523Draft_03715 [Frankia sp. BMG5.23]